MSGTIISGVYSATLSLNNAGFAETITTTGVVAVGSSYGEAVTGQEALNSNPQASWFLYNYGTLSAANGKGIFFFPSGTIANRSTVTNGSSANSSARIEGSTDGIFDQASDQPVSNTLSVNNFGTIIGDAAGTAGYGIYLQVAGTITNQATGLITSGASTLRLDADSTVTNFGTIQTTGLESGGEFAAIDFRIFNDSLNATNGVVVNRGNIDAAVGSYTPNGGESERGIGVLYAISLTNYGTISAGLGVVAAWTNDDRIVNQAGGLITSSLRGGIDLSGQGSYGTVANYGTIVSTGTYAATYSGTAAPEAPVGAGIFASGNHRFVVNGATTATHALIESAREGVAAVLSSVVNYGTIESTGTGTASAGVYLKNGTLTNTASGIVEGASYGVFANAATIVNDGTIKSTGTGPGAYLENNSTLTNGSTVATGALIESSAGDAIAGTKSGVSVVNNYGTIAAPGTAGGGIYVNSSSLSLTNKTSGVITSYRSAVFAPSGTGVTIANYGTIANTGDFAAIHLLANSVPFVNGSTAATGALIESALTGVSTVVEDSSIVNYGTITSTGTGTGSAGVYLGAWNIKLYNEASGTISADRNAVSGNAGDLGVTNDGTIKSTGGFAAIYLTGPSDTVGETVTNGSTNATGATITSSGSGIDVAATTGAVTNYGTIESNGTGTSGVAVYLGGAGSVGNNGLIESAGGNAVDIGTGGPGTVINFGTIENTTTTATTGYAVFLQSGGTIINYGLIKGEHAPQPALYGGVITTHGADATIHNLGTISATNIGDGVNLDHGGTIVNGNTGATGSLITGTQDGIYGGGHNSSTYGSGAASFITNYGTVQATGSVSAIRLVSVGTIVNFGTIKTSATAAQTVVLTAGGTVTNHELISGERTGISFTETAGTIVNSGTIASTAPLSGTIGAGVYLAAGGQIVNQAGGSITALRTAVALGNTIVTNAAAYVGNFGVLTGNIGVSVATADTGPTTIINYGTIESTGTGTTGAGVYLGGGGTVTNAAGGTIAAYGHAVAAKTDPATIVNDGTLENTGTGVAAVYLAVGSLTNGSSGAPGATIASARTAVAVDVGVGNVVNFGTIRSTSTGTSGSGVYLKGGGTVVNDAGGLITADRSAVATEAVAATVVNYGTIINTDLTNDGVYLGAGGSVTNGSASATSVLIAGNQDGVSIHGAPGTIKNFGTIRGGTSTAQYQGIYMGGGGTITNEAGALITADRAGIQLGGTLSTSAAMLVVNSGTISGTIGVGIGGNDTGATTIINYGTITGTGGTAIQLSDSVGTLVIEPGSQLGGSIAGSTFGDTVDFAHVIGTSAMFGNGVLSLMNNGTVVGAVGVTGNVPNSFAAVHSDNAGGTDITLSTASSSGTVISGTYTNTVNLTSASQNPVTVTRTGLIDVNSTNNYVNAIYGSTAAAWTVSNYGTVQSLGSAGRGIYLKSSGGTLQVTNAGLIGAAGTGVDLLSAGTIANSGTIASYAGHVAAFLHDGGTVTNTGTIRATGTGTANGLILPEGGSVINGVSGSPAGLISVYDLGIYIGGSGSGANPGAVGTVINYGTIDNTSVNPTYNSPAVLLSAGGTVKNFGLIDSAESHAIQLQDNPGTVLNYGSLESTTTTISTVFVSAGGTVVNGSASDAAATITTSHTGIAFKYAAGTVTNFGTVVQSPSAAAGADIYFGDGGTFTNEKGGTIEASRSGVALGGTIATSGNATVTNFGGISGNVGVTVAALDAGANTIVNSGTITGTGGTAIQLAGTATTLVIEQNSVLNGALAGFAAGDTIDFAHQSGTSVSFSYGVLSLMAGGAPIASVDLSGLYAAGEFAVASDGSGGTDVTFSADPSQAQLTTTSDFNGDGMSDVLWQNDNAEDSGSGQTAIWLMDGVNPTAEDIITTVPTSWHVVATGDFYGTGDAAILWQNDDGQAGLWEMNGTNPTAETVFASPPPSWHMIATGDFNGDGMSDVLWQYEDTSNSSDSQNGNVAIWEMNGASAIAAAVVAQPGPDWDVIGTGDFNGDGKSDILWQYEDSQNASDPQNGNVAIWEMNGLTPIAEAVVAQPGPDWHVVGTGDFNGDGKADILWQYEDGQNASDPQNGNVAIWLMNGTTPTAEAVVAQPGSAWHAIGTGDYDGSGKSDILWQNTNGQAAIWLMNGLTPTTESVFAAPPSSWHVIPS